MRGKVGTATQFVRTPRQGDDWEPPGDTAGRQHRALEAQVLALANDWEHGALGKNLLHEVRAHVVLQRRLSAQMLRFLNWARAGYGLEPIAAPTKKPRRGSPAAELDERIARYSREIAPERKNGILGAVSRHARE